MIVQGGGQAERMSTGTSPRPGEAQAVRLAPYFEMRATCARGSTPNSRPDFRAATGLV